MDERDAASDLQLLPFAMTADEKSDLAHRVLCAIGAHQKPAEADVLLLQFC